MDDPLDAVEVRVLGALIEKQYATPDNYPLTLNGLTAACNQTSNRDPVMALDEGAVGEALEALARRGFARPVHRGDSRVMRYRQEIGEKLHLHQPELAALAVLLLRGPQTVGEIRTRTSRLFEFLDLKHVEITLDGLSSLSTPLVTQLSRRPGQKEARYAHLLAGAPPEEEEASTEAVGEPPARAPGRLEALEEEVGSLKEELAALKAEFLSFRRQFE